MCSAVKKFVKIVYVIAIGTTKSSSFNCMVKISTNIFGRPKIEKLFFSFSSIRNIWSLPAIGFMVSVCEYTCKCVSYTSTDAHSGMKTHL